MRTRRRYVLPVLIAALLHLAFLALITLTRPAVFRPSAGGAMSVSFAEGLAASALPVGLPARPPPRPAEATPAPAQEAPSTTPTPPAPSEPPKPAPSPKPDAVMQLPEAVAPAPTQHAPAPRTPPAVAPDADFAAKVAQLVAGGTRLTAEAKPLRAAPGTGPSPLGPTPPSACQLDAALQASLGQDPEVLSALTRIPRKARSVANAIMLWNGRWIAGESVGGESALSSIRQSIQKGVRTASAACQQSTVRGPVLIAVLSQPETTILAIGSGEWRWADLLVQ